MESKMTVGWRGRGGVEGLGKKEKGRMDTDNSVVIAGGGAIRRLNGNGKKIQLNFVFED